MFPKFLYCFRCQSLSEASVNKIFVMETELNQNERARVDQKIYDHASPRCLEMLEISSILVQCQTMSTSSRWPKLAINGQQLALLCPKGKLFGLFPWFHKLWSDAEVAGSVFALRNYRGRFWAAKKQNWSIFFEDKAWKSRTRVQSRASKVFVTLGASYIIIILIRVTFRVVIFVRENRHEHVRGQGGGQKKCGHF